jgi:hypothetical protein
MMTTTVTPYHALGADQIDNRSVAPFTDSIGAYTSVDGDPREVC